MRIRAAAIGLTIASLALRGAVALDPPGPETSTHRTAPDGEAASLEVREPVTLRGTASTGRRQWVVGATVVLVPQSGECWLRTTATDERGVFEFRALPGGPYTLVFLKAGLRPLVKEHVVVRPPFRTILESRLEPETGWAVMLPEGPLAGLMDRACEGPPALRGTVRDRDGAPLAEVLVRATRRGGGADPRRAFTDETGSFALEDLEPGAWGVELAAPGFVVLRATLRLNQGWRLEATLVPQPSDYDPDLLDLLPDEDPLPPPSPEPAGDASPSAPERTAKNPWR